MKRLICMALLISVLFSSTFAMGALYGRRALSNDDSKPLWLKNYNATVKITDQIAVTHVDQTFKNETYNRLEGIFIFPLPNNAIVTELALWINGQRVIGSVMESDTARATYESIVRRSIDPALAEYMGKNVFKLSVFPIEPNGNPMSERRIEITYAELLPYSASRVEYKFYMKTVNLSPKPVSVASLSFDLISQKNILSISSPTHIAPELTIIKTGTNHYIGTMGNENTQSEKDFRLDYQLENKNYALSHLTYVPSNNFFDAPGDNPYYLLWVTPPDTAKPMKKNVVFVADVSASMSGTRIEQLRQSLKSMVAMLSPQDMFNIIPFSTSITLFRDKLITANPLNKAAAAEFVNQLSETGLTNISLALSTAMKSAWDDTSVNAIVFLTDGKPTWPDTITSKIIDTVAVYNIKKDISLFTFGIGDQVDEVFLKRLAKENNGFATMITSSDSISAMMSSFMHTISFPLIKNSTLNYGGLQTYDVLPNRMPNLYAGAQLTVLGRYKTSGEYQVTYKGTRGRDSVILKQNLAFPSGAENHPFVPRMWASAKVDALLSDIVLYGVKPELKDAVIALGKKYSIITPYTSLLVIEPPTSVPFEDKTASVSNKLALYNFPNPIKSFSTLRYSIPYLSKPQNVSIKIYDARGRLIRILVQDVTMGGNFVVRWDVKNSNGRAVPTGMYLAVLETSGGAHMMVSLKVIR